MTENSRVTVTQSVLDLYFSQTANMLAYLSELLEPVSGHNGSISEYLFNPADPPAYRALVSTTYVALKLSSADNSSRRRFKVYEPMVYMRDVSLK